MVPYAFSTKKNQLFIYIGNGEKKRNLKQLKRLKTPQMNEGNQKRRETRASSLREGFESNIYMIE